GWPEVQPSSRIVRWVNKGRTRGASRPHLLGPSGKPALRSGVSPRPSGSGDTPTKGARVRASSLPPFGPGTGLSPNCTLSLVRQPPLPPRGEMAWLQASVFDGQAGRLGRHRFADHCLVDVEHGRGQTR